MDPFDDTEDWFDHPDDDQTPLREDDDDEDRFVMDCGDPNCLMPGPHFLSECHTVQDMEAMEHNARLDRQEEAAR